MPQRRPQILAGSGLHPLGKCNKTRLYPGKGAGRSDEVGTWAGAVPVPRSIAFGARSACRQSRAFLRVGAVGRDLLVELRRHTGLREVTCAEGVLEAFVRAPTAWGFRGGGQARTGGRLT